MKSLSFKKIAVLTSMFAATFGTLSIPVVAQTVFQTHVFDIKLNGTSNLHDWEMTAEKGSSEAAFTIDAHGVVTSLSRLSFTMPATNLKSHHSGMDKNTYKALNTDKNPNISFVGSSATITPTGNNSYQLVCKGKLTIAGVTNETVLNATFKYSPADKSFTVSGVKKMKMTDYQVQPPKALLGTIKTGDEISISYNLTYSK